MKQLGISIRLACEIFGISQTCYSYTTKLSDENAQIADELVELIENYKQWGFKLCFDYLRNVKGKKWNHKCVYRIYCELKLDLRIKPRKRLKRDTPKELKSPEQPNIVWSMDFMSNALSRRKAIRAFNVIDDFNREGLCLDIDLSFSSSRVIDSLQRIIEWRGKPQTLRCDNGL
ncbi:Integrase core domain-containing protein [Thorsellia anophelis DSM 18579]|uniref:Integrase core domain-containing protein n=1 Tax=Thorsellia anophelis DSM 18579 TaxID=1123402 RepID=A0A1I0DI90_9GAMM|nr:Integrase core domain-containing protein [Thorsellia anophelis DSM 18579]